MKPRLSNLSPRDFRHALVVIFFAMVVSLSIASANSPLFGASRPLVASFAPISGSAGTTVTITGANFSAVTDVRFNNASATFTVDSTAQITAVVPSGATTGAIVVTTSAGTATSATSFIVGVSIPSGIRFTPVSGAAGASVTITGSGFSGATSVMFNGTPAAFTVDSATQITAVVPSGAATGAITVTNSEGSASSVSSFTVGVSQPVIRSFSPLSAEAGALVTISGENFTGATSVRFNNAPAIFLVTSSTQITASVPIGATTGAIAISTAAGTTTSKTSFTVGVGLPAIQTFEPASGEAGASVTITGSNFTSVTQVRFNESPASFTIDSESQITATVPAGAATGAISVQNSAGTSTSSISFVVGLAAPSVTSFSPSSATAGASVTITGTNLSGALSVTFNGTPASFVADSSTQITATVPSGATSGSISVTTAAGQASSSGSFTIGIIPPSIGGFSPVSGSVGSTVALTGTGFDMTLTVKFNGGNASFVVDSSTQITATVPASASAGPITVTTLTGTAVSASSFQVVDSPPSITSFSPTSGSAGIAVTISGTNFSGTTQVQFNGTNANFRVDSSTQITATVPSGATTGAISVTTPAGTASSSSSFSAGNFAPTITGFTPASGTVGTQVSIAGSNFSGVTQVQFNGTNASFTVVSSQEIKATVPPGATSGPITVTTSAGAATSSSNFTVTGPVNPVISDFSPSSGAAGTVVTINGANFAGTTSVKFNGTDASFMVNSSSQISSTTPAGATTGPITVTTVSESASSPSAFTVVASSAPTITGFSPTSGAAGTQVIITGTNFSNVTAVRFNGTIAGFTVNSSTQITATVPAGATSGPISVTTSAGTASSSTNFTVAGPFAPTISSFSPASGMVGDSVTINGSNFDGATAVRFNGTNASFTVNSSTQIVATVPAGATSGPISVTTPTGTATSPSNFSVVASPAPVITSFSPTSGSVGTQVTIIGANFTGATAVRFNGSSASFTVNSSTQITATVPVGATSGPISVTTPSGTGNSSTNFTVVGPFAPVITNFTPVSGMVGTSVTINGTNFTGATAVRFNGVNANFTVNSSTQITATVPPGATTGPISVSTTGDTAVSASNFQVIAPIVITKVTFRKKTLTILGSGFEAGDQVKIDGVLTDRTVVVMSSNTIIMTGKRKELRIKPAGSMHTYQVVRGTGSSNVFASAAPKT